MVFNSSSDICGRQEVLEQILLQQNNLHAVFCECIQSLNSALYQLKEWIKTKSLHCKNAVSQDVFRNIPARGSGVTS